MLNSGGVDLLDANSFMKLPHEAWQHSIWKMKSYEFDKSQIINKIQ